MWQMHMHSEFGERSPSHRIDELSGDGEDPPPLLNIIVALAPMRRRVEELSYVVGGRDPSGPSLSGDHPTLRHEVFEAVESLLTEMQISNWVGVTQDEVDSICELLNSAMEVAAASEDCEEGSDPLERTINQADIPDIRGSWLATLHGEARMAVTPPGLRRSELQIADFLIVDFLIEFQHRLPSLGNRPRQELELNF